MSKFWEELGVPLSSLRQARQVIELAFEAGTVPCVVGHAGIGKTEGYRQISSERGWGYIALYTQLSMPEDIGGLPFRSEDGKSYDLLVDNKLRKQVEENPQGGILVFEEVNRASRDTASAVFAFMDNRGNGNWRLPDTWKIAIAMNPSGGDYAVNDLTTDHAFRRRVTWICVREDVRGWIEYGRKVGFDENVLDFVQAHPAMLLDEKARTAGKTYANPAAWEKVSKTMLAIKRVGCDLEVARTKIAGDIGDVSADMFVEFVRNKEGTLSPSEVLDGYSKDGTTIRKRVLAAVEQGQLDRVSGLVSGVVREMVSSKPPAGKELASNIGTFLLDVPKELRAAFMSEVSQAQASSGDAEYVSSVNRYCALNGKYKQAIASLSQAIEKVEDEIG